MTDEELAGHLADGAGRLLLELRDNGFPSGHSLGLVGDRVANAFIVNLLREWRPDDPILSEESPDDLGRLKAERVWIIDPLDGTREYAEGRSDWAVHVALTVGGTPAAAAVAVPAQGVTFRTDRIPEVPAAAAERPVMVVSRTRPPALAEALAASLGAEIRPMGSAGAKAMAVLQGEADLYFHTGGQHEWDNCAPAAVALAAGLHASRVDGSPLVYNNRDTLVPDLVIARPGLARQVVDFCRT